MSWACLGREVPKFFHDERFRKAFGDEYGVIEVAKDGNERNFVAAYARKYTQEDFAEGVFPQKSHLRKTGGRRNYLSRHCKTEEINNIIHILCKKTTILRS